MGQAAGTDQEAFLRKYMESCVLCPRRCGADRFHGEAGVCGEGMTVRAGRAGLHMWEEPCLSGKEGSGAVFFTGCSLGCVFCQNYAISHGSGRMRKEGGNEPVCAGPPGTPGASARALTVRDLADVFLSLQKAGANNINLVTGCHFVPQIVLALALAKADGLQVPVVYNSSGYENPETLRLLEGYVDIWLPDFKYKDPLAAKAYSRAPDYPEIAEAALAEMVRQTGGRIEYDSRGLMTRGVIVRHLLMPGHVRNAKQVIKYLHDTYGDRILISIMNQYTPMRNDFGDPLLNRRTTRREYERVLDYALSIGVSGGFFQEGRAAEESFIPAFDGTGLSAAY